MFLSPTRSNPFSACVPPAPLHPPTDDFPKPQITVQPEPTVTVLGSDVRLTCTVASSSSSTMTFNWRKDQEVLRNAEVENIPHHQRATSEAPGGGVIEYTTILHLRHVTFAHEGRYQCIVSNHFGSTYSSKVRLVVNGRSTRELALFLQPPAKIWLLNF